MSTKRKVVIIGAGGHAKVVIDILKSDPAIDIVGCTDQNPGRTVAGIPVIGDDSILPELLDQGVSHAFVAIGGNRLRLKLAERVKEQGFRLVNAVSPRAYVADSAKLGVGIAVMPGAIVAPEVELMDFVIVNTNASVDHEGVIGRACHIAPGSALSGNVTVGEGTFLGTGTAVIDGITIGEWSMIGAGSVVVKALPERCLAFGVPAKVIKPFQA